MGMSLSQARLFLFQIVFYLWLPFLLIMYRKVIDGEDIQLAAVGNVIDYLHDDISQPFQIPFHSTYPSKADKINDIIDQKCCWPEIFPILANNGRSLPVLTSTVAEMSLKCISSCIIILLLFLKVSYIILCSCTDIDECTESNPMPCGGGRCINTPGSYRCDCPAGTEVMGAGIDCEGQFPL